MSPEVRQRILSGVQDAVSLGSSSESACAVVGVNPRRLQRWRNRPEDGRHGGLRTCEQKLCEAEKDAVMEAFHRPEYVHLPVRAAWVKMLDQGECLCSPATVFRILEERQAKRRLTVRRARPQRRPPVLEAKAVNQVWTWDITYLPTPVRGLYFYLYSIQDLFSRKIVGWSVEAREDGRFARDLFARMEIRCTHGRPRVSDDNAFIESWFSVLKGRTSFPEFFKDIEHARKYVHSMVTWYNNEHMHSRLDYLTPEQMDQGIGEPIQRRRNEVIERARMERPGRFGSRKLKLRVPNNVRLTFHQSVAYN